MFDKVLNWYFSKNALPYWCILILDCLVCFLSGLFVFWLFFRGGQTLANIVPVCRTLGLYIAVNIVMFRIFRTYSGIIRYSSFVDLMRIVYAMLAALVVVWLFHFAVLYYPAIFKPTFVPLGTRHIVSIYIVSTIGMWAMRVLVKSLYDVAFSSDKGMRALIYGVKDGGIGLAKNLRNEKPSRFQVKGFLANEPGYSGRILLGARVYDYNDNLKNVLKDLNIQAVLVSPLQNEAFRNDEELQDLLISSGVRIYMMQSPEKWEPGKELETHALKEVKVEDLLPRNEIQVDMMAIGELLQGKKILITGSAGSIGSEMVRQIAKYDPAELILVDQAETPQHDVRLEMAHVFPKIKAHTLIASISNAERMEAIFKQHKPDYVFHAAAYKHVPMMEDNPSESVQNNVYGTKVVADLSVKYGVKKFVMISTDKAVNPTNVMGCSKRICEIYVQSLNAMLKNAETPSCQFVTTRFGNVLGSNGSVIPLFEQQIKEGGPVTVTDPNVIRYFMLIPEACKLVLEAGTHGNGGEIFVFDMGKPVKIADLAKRMINLSGAKDVEIQYTGLRPGEKLYEEMLSNDENTLPSFHEKIRIAQVREYEYEEVNQQIDELIKLSWTFDEMAIVAKMKEIVPEFISKNSVYAQLDKEE